MTRVRSIVALGVAVAGFSSLALAQTTPALADPTEQLVVVGSDTIQDVWNAFALSASGNLLGSYNATNPVTGGINEVITPVDGHSGANCSFARPNGSGQGVAALRLSLNPNSTNASAAIAPLPQQGCVDIGRSSSGPGSLGNATNPAVDVQYIPFALDAVTGATGGTTGGTTFNASLGNGTTKSVTTAATVITQADAFTQADLTNLYNSCNAITEGGVTYWPAGSPNPQPAGSTVIDLYIPQKGSGTRTFWAQQTGNWDPNNPPACDHDTVIAGPLAPANTGGVQVPVEEHDGTAMTTDQNGYGPFSIAQFIAQTNGHNDRRHGVALHMINGVAPLTTTGALNSSFPITRDVYNVVSLARVTNTSDPLFALLNGPTSRICTSRSTILAFGFATIPNCGAITAANEAQP